MVQCKEVWNLVWYLRREQFCVTPIGTVVTPIVQEFYASLTDHIIGGGYGIESTKVIVREEVLIFSKEICEFYNIPYYEEDYVENINFNMLGNVDMEDVIKFLTQGRSTWNYRPNIGLPSKFNQAIIFPIVKIWMQFLCTRISPALNVSNVNAFQVVLLYGTLQ